MKKVKLLIVTLLFVSLIAITCNVNATTDANTVTETTEEIDTVTTTETINKDEATEVTDTATTITEETDKDTTKETTETSTGKIINWSYTVNENDEIENLVCTNKSSLTGVVTIPETLDGKKVVSLGVEAFKESIGITGVVLNDSLRTIGNSAFSGCLGIEKVDFNNIVSIGTYAFHYCSSIESVDLSKTNVKVIENYAFEECVGIQELNLGTTIIKIGKEAFMDCSGIKTLNIPNSVTTIGEYAFCGCSGLTSVTLPNKLTKIPAGLFKGCIGLKEVKIPESVTAIEISDTTDSNNGAFNNCVNLEKVLIPNTVVYINPYSFIKCPKLTIYGEEESIAQTYAKENSISFKLIENWDNKEEPTTPDKGTQEDNTNKDETTAPDAKLPQTGESIVILTIIITICGIITVLFMKNRKYKDIK